jgi:TM2 domain-containing membrane protein YozV
MPNAAIQGTFCSWHLFRTFGGMKQFTAMLNKVPLELVFWIGSLIAILMLEPQFENHLSLCPLNQLGLDWCPGMDEDQAALFAQVYRARRKDAQMILILTLLGFFGFAGLHRFILGQIGLGILYILTVGLCFIGTIVDLVNYKSLAYEYNIKVAHETLAMISNHFPNMGSTTV